MLVDQGRRLGARLEHVDDGGQFLQVQLDAIGEVLGFGARRRDAHGHEFADLAHLVFGEDVLIRCFEALKARIRPDGLNVF